MLFVLNSCKSLGMRGNNSSRQDRERKASAEIFLFVAEVTIFMCGDGFRFPLLNKDKPQMTKKPIFQATKKKTGSKI